MPGSSIVPTTAYLTAIARAEATADPRTEFHDEFAGRFAELCPGWILGITQRTAGRAMVVARTLAIDRMISEVLRLCEIDVCINLGSGFDSRPFRLEVLRSCRVIEIDTASVFDVKDRLLPSDCLERSVERLRCDVRDVETLRALLIPRTSGKRILVISEGLLTYLPESDVASLATGLLDLGKSVCWICDVISVESARILTAASHSAGVRLEMFGLENLRVFEDNGWLCGKLELLPSARLAMSKLGGSLAARPTTSLVPDAVLQLTVSGIDVS